MSNTPLKPIRIAILDDHPIMLDGYHLRLDTTPDLRIVATAYYGEELTPLLQRHSADVLILDVTVPTSPENSNPYPVLSRIPDIIERYPDTAILVISMHTESGLIRGVMQAGASGYVFKDDALALSQLAEGVRAVARGDLFLSPPAEAQLNKRKTQTDADLTPRQLAALSLCLAYPDADAAQLASKLFIAPSTFRNLMHQVYGRLGVSTRAGAVAEARHRGLITPETTPPLISGEA